MFVFLLPYVCASLWGHVGVDSAALRDGAESGEVRGGRILADMDWGVWELAPEEYVAYRLAEVMPDDYEPEALKAQAVLIRTELVRAWQEQGDSLFVSGEGLERWYAADAEAGQILTVYAEAASGTAGLYLTREGEPVQTPYFKVSNGRTRDAGEVWQTDQYPYLQSVPCEQDRAARDYQSETSVSKRKFLREIQKHLGEEYPAEELWENLQFVRDEAGYVTEAVFCAGEEEAGRMDGEAFRYLFDLPSSSFEAEQTDTQIIFHVTGVGHGFGMSQYAANCRAINGASYDQILQEFFCGTELAKIE